MGFAYYLSIFFFKKNRDSGNRFPDIDNSLPEPKGTQTQFNGSGFNFLRINIIMDGNRNHKTTLVEL